MKHSSVALTNKTGCPSLTSEWFKHPGTGIEAWIKNAMDPQPITFTASPATDI